MHLNHDYIHYKMSYMVFIGFFYPGISLHNFPEGMAVFLGSKKVVLLS